MFPRRPPQPRPVVFQIKAALRTFFDGLFRPPVTRLPVGSPAGGRAKTPGTFDRVAAIRILTLPAITFPRVVQLSPTPTVIPRLLRPRRRWPLSGVTAPFLPAHAEPRVHPSWLALWRSRAAMIPGRYQALRSPAQDCKFLPPQSCARAGSRGTFVPASGRPSILSGPPPAATRK